MSLFPTFVEVRSNMSNPEQWLQDYFAGGTETTAGTTVDQETATAISAVYACTTLIAETIAGLPLILYKSRKGGGKDRATGHRLYTLLKDQPNPDINSFVWRETSFGHLLLHGNRYSILKKDKLENVTAIHIKEPNKMSLKRVGGRLVYTYTENGKETKYPAQEILHTYRYSHNGYSGQSVIVAQREKLGTKKALDEFEARFFGQGTHPSGQLILQNPIRDNKKQWMKDFRRDFGGLGKSHSVMVLDNGAEYKPIGIPLDQAQFLELSKAKDVDICGCFKVPPHMIGILDRATFSNIEHQGIQFVQNCILPWLRVDEQTMNAKLLTDADRKAGYFFEYLVDGLLRGDAAARSSYYNQMFMIGGITQNEIRSKENMNPIEGGDVAYVPLNMIPIDQVGQETPEEPQEEKKSRESRSIVVRDRITKQYLPLLRKSAQKIINLEGNALKKQLKKHRKQRAKEPLQQWLDKFYIDMPEKIKREMGPVFKAFSEAIRSAAQDEIGKDTDISKFVADYIDRYADRHTESSQGPLVSLLGGEIDDLEARVDEWAETRADKIAASETLFLSDAIYEQVAMPVGVKTTWRTENRDISKLRELEANIIPKISRVAQKILNYETSKIKKAIEKLTRSQADDVNEWLEDFYNQHGAYVRVKFAPVMEKYAHAINREASRIVGKPLGMTPEVEQYTKDYLEKYAFRYCHAGKRQLQALIIEEALNPELFKVELVQRLEEWLEKRADKIAADESVRASNALSREVWRNHGVTKLKWVARGESCPFCNHLNGKVVGIEKNFLEAGDVIYVNDKLPGKNHIYNPLDPNSKKPDVDYDDPLTNQANWQALKTHGQKAHAPIHRGCDCRVMPV